MATPRKPAGPVPAEALRYFKAKGLKPGFSYLDVWREEHAFAFTVAKVMQRDLLAKVAASLQAALEDGVPFEQWATSGVRDTLDEAGWTAYGTKEQEPSRLRKIYETNMRVARAAGQWERVQRTKRQLPYLLYALGPSEKHRPEHEAWAGLVLPVDDPFWDTHAPPNGWGCKCRLIQLTQVGAEQRGIDEAPDDGTYEWTNPKTGGTEELPVGIDPGWDFNPGKARAERLAEEDDE
jgi:SPP1 gp7 family putative phage head morphogenesis protein